MNGAAPTPGADGKAAASRRKKGRSILAAFAIVIISLGLLAVTGVGRFYGLNWGPTFRWTAAEKPYVYAAAFVFSFAVAAVTPRVTRWTRALGGGEAEGFAEVLATMTGRIMTFAAFAVAVSCLDLFRAEGSRVLLHWGLLYLAAVPLAASWKADNIAAWWRRRRVKRAAAAARRKGEAAE